MKISPERRRGIEFHIKNDDYFGTLATVLDLHRQMLGKSPREREIASVIENQVNDLMHLQDNYEIKPKKKKRK